jgi:hypothetical protein
MNVQYEGNIADVLVYLLTSVPNGFDILCFESDLNWVLLENGVRRFTLASSCRSNLFAVHSIFFLLFVCCYVSL